MKEMSLLREFVVTSADPTIKIVFETAGEDDGLICLSQLKYVPRGTKEQAIQDVKEELARIVSVATERGGNWQADYQRAQKSKGAKLCNSFDDTTHRQRIMGRQTMVRARRERALSHLKCLPTPEAQTWPQCRP